TMPWERRGRGLYFTTTRRVQGRRRRAYFGSGRFGQLAAAMQEIALLEREESARALEEDRRQWQDLQLLLVAFDDGAKMLSAARLLAAGYRAHRGQWRRPRDAPAER